MSIFGRIKRLFLSPKSHEVALVLGGGGARGIAHIGAIEALEERGYVIHSVTGTSIGALVGGLWAAGKMKELKDIVLKLNKKEVLSLMDISIGLNHLMSGEKLLMVFNQLVGDRKIEDLPVNFCCSASDLVSGKETVFRRGSLKMAMRASISIPCFFTAFTVFSAFSASILFSHVRFVRTCLLRLPLALIPAITHTHAIAYTNVCTRFAAKT